MTKPTKTTRPTNSAKFIVKYLKEAQYESKLFKIVEMINTHTLLHKFIKQWEGVDMIYLKNKYLNEQHTELITGNYYKVMVYFEQFTNDEGKEIVYINKIRHKSVEFEEVAVFDTEDF